RRARRRAVLAALALAAAAAGLAAADAGSGSPVAPGTREMAALLEQSAALVDPLALSLVVNDRRALLLARQLAPDLPAADRLRLRGALVVELINAGRVDEALRALDDLRREARADDPGEWPQYQASALMLEAVADTRLAED